MRVVFGVPARGQTVRIVGHLDGVLLTAPVSWAGTPIVLDLTPRWAGARETSGKFQGGEVGKYTRHLIDPAVPEVCLSRRDWRPPG